MPSKSAEENGGINVRILAVGHGALVLSFSFALRCNSDVSQAGQ